MIIYDMFGYENTVFTRTNLYGETSLFTRHVQDGVMIEREYSNEFSIEMEFNNPFVWTNDTFKKVLDFYHEGVNFKERY